MGLYGRHCLLYDPLSIGRNAEIETTIKSISTALSGLTA